MARPIHISNEQILSAAREVFLERGIRATTAEVATRAGVSEGSVFKRFPSKYDLFRAAVHEIVDEPAWLTELPARIGKGDLKHNLTRLGIEVIGFFRSIMPLIMLGWSNPSPDALPKVLTGKDPPPIRVVRALSRYFSAEMRLGRMRRLDAEVVARAFIGGLNHYVFTEVLLRETGEASLSAESFVRGFVQLLFKGIEV